MPSLSLSPWPHSTFQSGLNKFCLGTNSTSRTCKRCYWHWSNWCRVTDVFHHQRAVTSLSCKSPAQSQLAVEMTVLPVQLLLQLVPSLTENHRFSLWGAGLATHPLAEADHGPHGAAQSAAAAETTKQQPANIDWQSFPQSDVNTRHCGLHIIWVSPLTLLSHQYLELLRGHTWV